ncbi:MAG: hypothetical protein HZR80_19355 [Candidatus Heimdallarchaeota archaeon]
MEFIFIDYLEVLNVMPYPYRFDTLRGLSMIGLSLPAAALLFVIVFFVHRYFQKLQQTYDRSFSLSYALTITSSLGTLVFFVYLITSLFLGAVDSFLLLSFLPFSFCLLLTICFYFWYRQNRQIRLTRQLLEI